MNDTSPTRALMFAVVDRNGQRVEGASVRFYVNNKLLAEARSQKDSPIRFEISAKVEIVDIEVFYGTVHVWTKESMGQGYREFTIDVDVAPPPPPPPASDPVLPGPVRRNPTVIAAGITAGCALLGSLMLGYWQYGPKHSDHDQINLRVHAIDSSDQSPINNADVIITDGASVIEKPTDGSGLTPVVQVAKSGSKSLTVSAHAPGYGNATRYPDRPAQDDTYTLELQRPQASLTPVRWTLVVSGTWTVQGIGDPKNERISNGTLSFVKKAVGQAVLTGHLRVDGIEVALTGNCEWQGREMHMSYEARSEQGGSWTGTADLTAISATRLSGRFQSKRGDDVPLVLAKD